MNQVCNVKGVESRTNVLVTGASGQLGVRLLACAATRTDVDVVGLSRDELDVTNDQAVRNALRLHRPDVVIHAAAFTGVDDAEDREEEATLVNAEGVRLVSSACLEVGASMIHISTDYVFGHIENRPLLPGDPVQPLGAYARSKQRGETLFLASGVRGAIVRVAWLYDTDGNNFLNTMLRLARDKGKLRVVDDQFGVPTAAPVFAMGLLDMAAKRRNMPQGIWHFSHQGFTSWHGFAQEIIRLSGLDVPVEPVASDEFPTKARRPVWSVLDGEPLRLAMDWRPMHWKEALKECWRMKKTIEL